jgi:putative flippase GtrA
VMFRQAKSLTDSTHRQLLRYGITGLISNAVMFIGYVLATGVGMGHKAAMSVFYGLSVLQTFAFNRRWTFRHGGRLAGPFLKHVTVYLAGYVFNLAGLVFFVDVAGLPHLAVQAVLIVLIAILLFVLQKYWVFPVVETPVYLDSGT